MLKTIMTSNFTSSRTKMRIPAQVSHGVLLDYLAHIVTLGLLGQVWYGEAFSQALRIGYLGREEVGQDL